MTAKLATVIAILALMVMAGGPSLGSAFIDPDYYWHVVLGQEMLAGGKAVAPDDVSFATVRTPYRRHSWGADMLMAEADRRWGVAGYRLLRALLRAATAGLVAVACLRANRSRAGGGRSRAGQSPVLALGLAALVLPFCAQLEEMRPIALAHVLLAGAAAIHIGRERTPGALAAAATIAIALALSPVHPTVIVLLAWLGATFVGARAEAALGRGGAEARARAGFYMRLTAATVLVLLVDPQPFGALQSAIFLRADPMASGRHIQEWVAPQAAGATGWLGIGIGLAAVAALARSKRTRLDEAVLLAGMVYLGYDLARNTILLAFVALPLLARHLGRGPRPWRVLRACVERRLYRAPRPTRAPLMGLLGAVACLAIALSMTARDVSSATLSTDPVAAAEAAQFPALATSWALENVKPVRGRVLAPYTWGGYLAYRLLPRFQVYQYGQNQLYDAQFWEDFTELRFEAVRKRLVESGADFAILPNVPAPLAGPWHHILTEAGWTEVHREGQGIVLLPPAR